MKQELTFNQWAESIDQQLKAYYQKQKEESKKKFEQYYK